MTVGRSSDGTASGGGNCAKNDRKPAATDARTAGA